MSYRPLALIDAAALLVALADVPYGYFQLLRWLVCGVSAYGAFQAREALRTRWMVALGALAVLFNPVLPFYLDRATWQVIDVGAAVVLVVSAFAIKQGERAEAYPPR